MPNYKEVEPVKYDRHKHNISFRHAFNGILLAPHVDHLFDKGFISFSNDGDVLVSSHLPIQDLKKLGLEDHFKNTSGLFRPEQALYLDYHRNEVFYH